MLIIMSFVRSNSLKFKVLSLAKVNCISSSQNRSFMYISCNRGHIRAPCESSYFTSDRLMYVLLIFCAAIDYARKYRNHLEAFVSNMSAILHQRRLINRYRILFKNSLELQQKHLPYLYTF